MNLLNHKHNVCFLDLDLGVKKWINGYRFRGFIYVGKKGWYDLLLSRRARLSCGSVENGCTKMSKKNPRSRELL